MKKALFGILAIVLLPVLLFAVGAALLYVPAIQNWAVGQVANAVSSSTGMEVSVGRVSLVFPLDLGIYDFRVVQRGSTLSQPRDTVADVGSLVVDVRLSPLLGGKVVVDKLELSGAKINTAGLVPEARVSGEIGRLSLSSRGIDLGRQLAEFDGATLTDARVRVELRDTVVPPDTASAPTPWKINIGKLDIKRTSIDLHTAGDSLRVQAGIGTLAAREAKIDLGTGSYAIGSADLADATVAYDDNLAPRTDGLDPGHIALSEVNIGLDSILYHGPDIRLAVRHCRMKEKSGLQLADLRGPVAMDSVRISLPSLKVRTPDSDLKAEAAIDLSAMDAARPGRISVRLLASIGKQDIMRFAGGMPDEFVRAWPNRPLTVRGSVNGTVRSLDITGLQADLPTAFTLKASGKAANVTDAGRLQADLKVEGRTDDLGFVAALAGPGAPFALPRMAIDGTVKADGSAYSARLTMREGMGSVSLDGRFNAATAAYKASLAVNSLNVAHFMPADSIGTVSCQADVEGRGFDFMSPSCRLEATARVDSMAYGGWNIANVSASATLRNGIAHATIEGDNQLFDGSLAVDATLNRRRIEATLTAAVRKADLQQLRVADAPLTAGLSSSVNFHTDLNQLYYLHGSVSGINIETPKQAFHPTDITFHLYTSPDTTNAAVASGSLSLSFAARGGYETLMAQAEQFLAEAERQRNEKIIDQGSLSRRLPRFRLSFASGDGNPFANFLKTKGITFSDMAVALRSSPERGLNGNMHLYSLVADSTAIDTVRFFVAQDSTSRFRYIGKVTNRKDNPMLAFTALFNGYYFEREAGLNVRLLDAADSLGLHIGAEAEMCDSGINVRLVPERPVLGYTDFGLNADNYIFLGRDKRVRAKVDLIADGNMGVKIYSDDTNAGALQDITVSLNKLDIGRITSALPFMPSIEGLLYGDFHAIQDMDERLTVISDMTLDGFAYEGNHIGDIGSDFAYLMRDSASHFVEARVRHNGREVGLLRGKYTDGDGGSIDADMDMTRLPLVLVNGFVPDRLISLFGYAYGRVSVDGPLSSPTIDGTVRFDSAFVASIPYGLRMRMDNDSVRILDSHLLFEDFTVYGSNGNPLSINGSFDFSDPSRMAIDMQMRAQNYQLINSRKTRRSVAYGKAFVNFYGAVDGSLDRLRLRGQLDVLGGTDLTYVLKDSPLSSNDRLSEIVTFTDFSDTTATAPAATPQLGGMDMELMLNVEPGARIMCALNADESNYINLEGGGQLRLIYNDIDNMQLIGRYTLNEGEMKYALPIIPLKTFHIQQGSYIEFGGDVMNPGLNITATEQVKANVGSESGASRTVLFDCGVKVTKTLQDMGLEFTVDAPEDLTLKNELAAMSVEQRGKIAVTMLTTGMYLADGNTGGFTMNNALNSFLQSEINNITNSAMKSIDMSVGMDQSSDASGNTRTDYSFQFAKRFWNNRFSFIIGGKVSSGGDNTATGNQNESFIDNVSLEYRLDQSAQRYVRLFYNKNADDLLEGEITEYGAGFVWRKKMESLGELFDFRTKKKKAASKAANDSTKTDGKTH